MSPKRPRSDKTLTDNRKAITTTERSLMDMLLQVGKSAIVHTSAPASSHSHMPVLTVNPSSATTPATTIVRPQPVDPVLEQFELAQTLNPEHLSADVPSLDNLIADLS